VITGVAFCPHPPVLVPALAQGAAPGLAPLRTACDQVITKVASTQPEQWVVLGAGPESRLYSPLARGTLAGFGLPMSVSLGSPGCGGPDGLPLSLTIGGWLLGRSAGPRSGAIGIAVGPGFAASHAAADLLGLAVDARIGLLVMGDGTARRSRQAPGYFDGRAEGYDALVETALRAGDAATLAGLDVALGTELLAAGPAVWAVAGELTSGNRLVADVRYADAPYGVQYFAASWVARA
jgi:hypothetical protein